MLIIPYNSDTTEFEVQSELYHLLKEKNILVRGEITSTDYSTFPTKKARFDIVAYNENKKPVAVVEVKRKKGLIDKAQTTKYKDLLGEIPLVFCEGRSGIARTLASIEQTIPINRTSNIVKAPQNAEEFSTCVVNYMGGTLLDLGVPLDDIIKRSCTKYMKLTRKRALRAYTFFAQECGFPFDAHYFSNPVLLDSFLDIIKIYCQYCVDNNIKDYRLTKIGSKNKSALDENWLRFLKTATTIPNSLQT